MTERPTEQASGMQRPLSLAEAIVPVAALIGFVALSYFLFGDAGAKGPNQVALTAATMIAVAIGRWRGISFDDLSAAAVASVSSGMGAIFILFAVGALVGAWAMSGTLVAMVYYGLRILDPLYFYVSVATIAAIISFGIGSSWTLVGTVGIGLMVVAAAMELSLAITAGAVISGAYFGDTVSPLSDSANLAAGVADVNLYDHLKQTAPVSAAALAIALAVFWFLGGGEGGFDASEKMATLNADFDISLVLFLPLVVVVALAVMKLPPFTTIFIGALVGGILAGIVAPDRVVRFADPEGALPRALAIVKGVWLAIADGYVSTTGHPVVDTLATRGGMSSMLTTVWLIIAAFAFGGVIERIGALERLMAPVAAAFRSAWALVTVLVASVFATNVATADQYLSIVVPGRMFKATFAERGLPPLLLSRTVGLTGTPTSALVPWNSCGAYMAATLGVATLSYAPFAIFNLANPLLAILVTVVFGAAVRPTPSR
jgi:Na+:H+ antiporter, NhaC family